MQQNPVAKADSSVSNINCAILPSRLFAPNAFTPNDDTLNDVWKISALSIYNRLGSPIAEFHLQIFNRWGTQIWQSNDIHAGWDGNYEGKEAPMDVYVYVINAAGIDGKRIHLKGTISLLR